MLFVQPPDHPHQARLQLPAALPPGPSPTPVRLSVSPTAVLQEAEAAHPREDGVEVLRAAVQRRGAHALPPGDAPRCVHAGLSQGGARRPQDSAFPSPPPGSWGRPRGRWTTLGSPDECMALAGSESGRLPDPGLGAHVPHARYLGPPHGDSTKCHRVSWTPGNTVQAQYIISTPQHHLGASAEGAVARMGGGVGQLCHQLCLRWQEKHLRKGNF